MAEFAILGILGIFALPFLLLTLFWAVYGIAMPLMFIWGMLTSGRNLDKMIEETNARERSTRTTLGRDPLSTVDRWMVRSDVTNSGLIYASGVFGPSYWQLMIAWVNNLTGGSVTVFQKVISAGRAEVMQRLRENAIEAGWDDVVNVRIDTADMTPQSSQRGKIRGVEVFAYGTGIKYS